MKKLVMYFAIFMISGVFQPAHGGSNKPDFSPVEYDRKSMTEDIRISRGGQLYDNWWKTTTDTEKPEEDHPLWKLQSTNKRSGYSTYRCKECHGWDYRGKDGAYSDGSHYTGFTGVYDASQKMRVKELEDVLRGSTSAEHDFSKELSKDDISDLALFLKYGVLDLVKFINTEGLPIDGDREAGRNIFTKNCMTECHGPDGTTINFGSEEKPEFISTLAIKNPWEFIHKVRAGQPGTRMSSGIINTYSEKDIRDLLSYSRTLPQEHRRSGWFGRIQTFIGFGDEDQYSYIPEKKRGFGPKIEQ